MGFDRIFAIIAGALAATCGAYVVVKRRMPVNIAGTRGIRRAEWTGERAVVFGLVLFVAGIVIAVNAWFR
jgi:hypothetical protein